MNGSNYTDASQVEIYTLDGTVSLTVRNDASFIFDDSLNLYEHQSTICGNITLRILYYVADILKRYTKDMDLYGRNRIEIPTPRFAVFYNGTEKMPEVMELHLSDLYAKKDEKNQLELTCMVYNINKGNNDGLLGRCSVLKEYMIFVDYVRFYTDQFGPTELVEAMETAIDRCIEEDVLKDFLDEHRMEVIKVMTLDYSFERRIELAERDAKKIGLEEGKKEGIKDVQKIALKMRAKI